MTATQPTVPLGPVLSEQQPAAAAEVLEAPMRHPAPPPLPAETRPGREDLLDDVIAAVLAGLGTDLVAQRHLRRPQVGERPRILRENIRNAVDAYTALDRRAEAAADWRPRWPTSPIEATADHPVVGDPLFIAPVTDTAGTDPATTGENDSSPQEPGQAGTAATYTTAPAPTHPSGDSPASQRENTTGGTP